eukprot:2700212-Amphidinium_carterae.3
MCGQGVLRKTLSPPAGFQERFSAGVAAAQAELGQGLLEELPVLYAPSADRRATPSQPLYYSSPEGEVKVERLPQPEEEPRESQGASSAGEAFGGMDASVTSPYRVEVILPTLLGDSEETRSARVNELLANALRAAVGHNALIEALPPRLGQGHPGRGTWRLPLPSRIERGGVFQEEHSSPVVALWLRVTFRYGEARHPGPPQRIVTVNPRGWSRMAPLLSKMKEKVILVPETFLAVAKSQKPPMRLKLVTLASARGRPQGGLAVLSRVATPAVVPHSGHHYDKGRWMHVIVHLEVGGRTLHVFNVYGYDDSYPDACEWNRSILDEMLPHVHSLRDHPYVIGGDWNFEPDEFPIPLARGDTVVRPPSDNKPTSPYTKGEQGRQIDWFLISPHMRDSVGAEYRLESQPDHYAVGLTLSATWIPQTFLKKGKPPPAVTDHPAGEWPGCWALQMPLWSTALQNGDVDAAWACWNIVNASTAALGLQPGDRGRVKVQQAKSPELQKDATVTQDLQARHDLELAWFWVQEEAIPLLHWPS